MIKNYFYKYGSMGPTIPNGYYAVLYTFLCSTESAISNRYIDTIYTLKDILN